MSNDKKKDSVIALTPAEQGELAVIEEKYRKLAEDTKVEYLAGLKFKKKLEDPEIRVAARKAAIAMNELHKADLQVVDFSVGMKGVEVELECLVTFNKMWISVGRNPRSKS